MANDTMGFAILGAGVIADHHVAAIQANSDLGAQLVAMGHYSPDRFEAISAQFGVPCLTEADLLARDDVDVVCICTPSGQHAAQTMAAAEAGKHVLVEKPMALNPKDADAMIAACERAGVKLGVCFQSRGRPLFQRIHAAIQGGELGDLTIGIVTMPYFRPQSYYDQAAWRGTWELDGGGVLMNQGIHQVDLLVWLMGDPVKVEAFGGTLHRRVDVEDTLAAMLHFPNGALATITATTTANPGFPHRLEIYGTGGGICTEGDVLGNWQLVEPTSTVDIPETGTVTSAGAGSDPRGTDAHGHTALFRDFIQAVREDRLSAVHGGEGRRSVAVVNAIYEAAGLAAS
ncbi:MAG: Gfo/Idh/MocA family oxidoreductase [Chloroflexi bacterium]|nr:Gfo/Idh/MocA family oxidoreductase [Chloroflexota bacterium]